MEHGAGSVIILIAQVPVHGRNVRHLLPFPLLNTHHPNPSLPPNIHSPVAAAVPKKRCQSVHCSADVCPGLGVGKAEMSLRVSIDTGADTTRAGAYRRRRSNKKQKQETPYTLLLTDDGHPVNSNCRQYLTSSAPSESGASNVLSLSTQSYREITPHKTRAA